jgi:endonuclease G
LFKRKAQLLEGTRVKRSAYFGVCWSFFLVCAAEATECPQHYVQGKAPVILSPSVAAKTTEVCYEAFAVMHSGLTRTPLWSAEHLVRGNIESAQSMSRQNAFHADANLPNGERAELGDYARSGFDRGHVAPNGDMPTRSAQYESFTLANMVPQNPNNNRYIWEGIESSVRRLAKSDGDIYVLSGPAFIGDELQRVGNVLVPTHLFKVVYRPRVNQAAAYFLKNEATKEYTVISVAQLERTVGIDLLPGVSQGVKDVAANLPRPTPHNADDDTGTTGKRRHGPRTAAPDDYRLNSKILDAVEQLLRYLKK